MKRDKNNQKLNRYNRIMHPEDTALLIMLAVLITCTLSVVVINHVFHLPLSNIIGECAMYRWIGIYCPACGGTRAFLAMIDGHLIQSLYYHPIVEVGTVFIFLFLAGRIIAICSRGKVNILHAKLWWLWMMLTILGLHFILRNVLLLFFQITI